MSSLSSVSLGPWALEDVKVPVHWTNWNSDWRSKSRSWGGGKQVTKIHAKSGC